MDFTKGLFVFVITIDMFVNRKWNNENVIITGASKGLGHALAIEFTKLGANVLALARSERELISLKNYCQPFSGKLIFKQIDLSSDAEIFNLIEWIKFNWMIPSILINNAALGQNSEIIATCFSETIRIIKTNYISQILLSQMIGKQMVANNGGLIVFVSSLAGKWPFNNMGIYTSAKWGIEGYSKVLRNELSDKNVNVMVVRPGKIRTNFFENIGIALSQKELKKMKDPHYIAIRILQAISNGKNDLTIGKDKYFLFFKPLLPKIVAEYILSKI